MTEKVQTKVYLPPDVKAMLDADSRSNSDVVEAALITEFGGERETALERRVEEKQRRKSNLESEMNERRREIETVEEEIRGLKERLETQQEQRSMFIAEAAEKLEPAEWYSSLSKEEQIPDTDSEAVQSLAEQTDITADELRAEVVDYILTDGGSE